MNKLHTIIKTAALVSFVLTTNSIQATETTPEAVLVPVKNPITGEVEMRTCPDYPDCEERLSSGSANDEQAQSDEQ